MKKYIKQIISWLPIVILTIAIIVIAGFNVTAIKITDIQLNAPDRIEYLDTCTITPEFTFNKEAPNEKQLKKELERLGMHYTSDDTSVVTVDDDGTIQTVGVGTAHITYANNSEKLVATKTINVVISPQKISLPDTIYLTSGKTEQLNPTIEPQDATNKDVQYISDDPKVAAVDISGEIKGLTNGQATITAKIKGTDITAETTIIVQPKIEKIEVKNTSVIIKEGDTKQILYSVIPDGAYTESIEYNSENPEVAIIDKNGVITAVAKGSTTVTITADDISATCKVTVQQDMGAAGPIPNRIVIPDLNINTGLVSGNSQTIVDAADSAAIWQTGLGITVADHWNQGNYTNIQYSVPGSTIAYINGIKYICTACFGGHNNGTCVTDNAGNDIMNTLGAGQALLYTCNGCWQNVHIAIYQAVE